MQVHMRPSGDLLHATDQAEERTNHAVEAVRMWERGVAEHTKQAQRAAQAAAASAAEAGDRVKLAAHEAAGEAETRIAQVAGRFTGLQSEVQDIRMASETQGRQLHELQVATEAQGKEAIRHADRAVAALDDRLASALDANKRLEIVCHDIRSDTVSRINDVESQLRTQIDGEHARVDRVQQDVEQQISRVHEQLHRNETCTREASSQVVESEKRLKEKTDSLSADLDRRLPELMEVMKRYTAEQFERTAARTTEVQRTLECSVLEQVTSLEQRLSDALQRSNLEGLEARGVLKKDLEDQLERFIAVLGRQIGDAQSLWQERLESEQISTRALVEDSMRQLEDRLHKVEDGAEEKRQASERNLSDQVEEMRRCLREITVASANWKTLQSEVSELRAASEGQRRQLGDLAAASEKWKATQAEVVDVRSLAEVRGNEALQHAERLSNALEGRVTRAHESNERLEALIQDFRVGTTQRFTDLETQVRAQMEETHFNDRTRSDRLQAELEHLSNRFAEHQRVIEVNAREFNSQLESSESRAKDREGTISADVEQRFQRLTESLDAAKHHATESLESAKQQMSDALEQTKVRSAELQKSLEIAMHEQSSLLGKQAWDAAQDALSRATREASKSTDVLRQRVDDEIAAVRSGCVESEEMLKREVCDLQALQSACRRQLEDEVRATKTLIEDNGKKLESRLRDAETAANEKRQAGEAQLQSQVESMRQMLKEVTQAASKWTALHAEIREVQAASEKRSKEALENTDRLATTFHSALEERMARATDSFERLDKMLTELRSDSINRVEEGEAQLRVQMESRSDRLQLDLQSLKDRCSQQHRAIEAASGDLQNLKETVIQHHHAAEANTAEALSRLSKTEIRLNDRTDNLAARTNELSENIKLQTTEQFDHVKVQIEQVRIQGSDLKRSLEGALNEQGTWLGKQAWEAAQDAFQRASRESSESVSFLKQRLDETKQRLEDQVAQVSTSLAETSGTLNRQITNAHADLQAKLQAEDHNLQELGTEVKQLLDHKIRDLETATTEKRLAGETQLRTKMEAVEAQVRVKIEEVQVNLTREITAGDEKIDNKASSALATKIDVLKKEVHRAAELQNDRHQEEMGRHAQSTSQGFAELKKEQENIHSEIAQRDKGFDEKLSELRMKENETASELKAAREEHAASVRTEEAARQADINASIEELRWTTQNSEAKLEQNLLDELEKGFKLAHLSTQKDIDKLHGDIIHLQAAYAEAGDLWKAQATRLTNDFASLGQKLDELGVDCVRRIVHMEKECALPRLVNMIDQHFENKTRGYLGRELAAFQHEALDTMQWKLDRCVEWLHGANVKLGLNPHGTLFSIDRFRKDLFAGGEGSAGQPRPPQRAPTPEGARGRAPPTPRRG